MDRRKIVLRSLMLLLLPVGYGILVVWNYGDFYQGAGFALLLLMWTLGEVGILLLLALIALLRSWLLAPPAEDSESVNKVQLRKAVLKKSAGNYFIAAGLVLLVGASVCYGGIAVIKAVS